ncbi:MAG: adenosylcobinamide-GDP ribazoletransferase [Ilumatobacter sp.]
MPPFAALGALQFLTRIPIRLRAAPDIAASVPWFPVIGALIGAAVGGVAAGLMEVVPAAVAAAVAVVVGMMVTGAFHEDGLADTADAMGGFTPERRREILKDSRHGSYGVVAMVATVLIRVVSIAALNPAAAFAGLVAAHTLGRGAAVAVMGLAHPVPTEGLGADYARSLTPGRAVTGVLASLGLGALAVGWWVLPLAGAVGIGALLVSVIAQRAFGGVSGDILGAVEQVGECLALIIVSGLVAHHTVWWA